MAFTRFHDDSYRMKKQVQESSDVGSYYLNTPGQGMNLPYERDPQIRLQKWGANLQTNYVELENELHGITRKYNRHLPEKNNYKQIATSTQQISYKSKNPTTEESRSSHPAWEYRDLEQVRWERPFLNPQNDLEKRFSSNIQTRILEKDHFQPKIPMVQGRDDFYLHQTSICMGGKNECNHQLMK